MTKYIFNWSGIYPIYITETSIKRLSILKEFLGEDAKSEVIMFSKKGEVSCYSLKEDKNLLIASKRFLEKDFTKRLFDKSQKTREDYWKLANKLRELTLNKLSNKDLLDYYTETNSAFARIFCSFELTRPELQIIPEERLKNLIKSHFKDETVINSLLALIEADEFVKEKNEWFDFCTSDHSDEELLEYAYKKLWLFPGVKDKNQLLEFIKERYDETRKLGPEVMKAKINESLRELEERKKEQENLFRQADSEELETLSRLFQGLALERVRLKTCWEDARYHINQLLAEISNRTNVPINELFSSYTLNDIVNLLENNVRLPNETIKTRENYYLFKYSNSEITFLEGKQAEGIISSIIYDLVSKIMEIKGATAFPGKVKGKVVVVPTGNLETMNKSLEEFNKGDILVTPMTQPNMVIFAEKASAIVTNEGGITSHASVIAREFKIPCIVGTGVATKKLNTGDLVEVDAEKGIVRKIE
jgi:phosphohistidine swiveling domain-containing protein